MAEKTKVTRITAKDETPKTAKAAPAKKSSKSVKTTAKSSGNKTSGLGAYFKGAWEELKQVRWPNRKATWGLTLAVLLFSAFFVALILLLDLLFGYIFELIIV